MIRPVTICLAFVVLTTTARAGTIYHVYSGGSIQDAINDAVSGDEIIVHPGTYPELIDFNGKAITLRSSDGPEVTIIDGRGWGTVVRCEDIDVQNMVPVLGGFTIIGGEAYSGGGMYVRHANPTVVDCVFLANTAGAPFPVESAYGGGLYLYESDATVVDCSFLGNSASADVPAPTVTAWGGGIYLFGGSLTVINSTFSGNSVSAETMGLPEFASYARGGGIGNEGGDLTVTNCTFCGNSASATPLFHEALGAGVCAPSGGTTSATNCIFYANSTATPSPDVYGAVVVSYSCMQFPYAGIGNIWTNPMLADADGVDDVFGTEDDDIHLHEDSPCINAGDNEAVPSDITTDFEGDERIRHCRVDMGVDETPYIGYDCNGNGVADACDVTVLYVDDDAPPGGDGDTWATAYDDLQPALLSIDCAVREVRVADGTYQPGDSRMDTFQLLDGVALRGGYRGLAGGGDPDDRGLESILSGDIPGANSYHVVTGSGTGATAVLDGFTIIAGNADGDEPHYCGGGMYNDSGNPTVTDCVFSGNSADWGGGMGNLDSDPRVTNCTFVGNSAGTGGGMSNRSSDPTLTHCTFIGNSAGPGGGMDNMESSPRVNSCRFIGNSSSYGGGGMYNYKSPSVVTNCTFSGNIADDPYYGCRGGGIRNESGLPPIVTNCTFSENRADEGRGMYTSHGEVLVTNCILWGDAEQTIPQIEDGIEGTTTVHFSCVQDEHPGDGIVYPGPGNIDGDPLLVDAYGPDGDAGTEDDDLHLLPGSPCINTGLLLAAELPERDLDGHARVLCNVVDMGAYEFGIGDYQCDEDVDLDDFGVWEDCMTGPNAGPYPPCCEAFDFDYDGDVDLYDLAGFQVVFEEP